MSQFRLNRVILALVLLELACAGQLVATRPRVKHAHRYRQSWSWPRQNWWNWWNMPPPASKPAPAPAPPRPQAQSSPPVTSVAPVPQPQPTSSVAPVPQPQPTSSVAPVPQPQPTSSVAPVPQPQPTSSLAPVPPPQPTSSLAPVPPPQPTSSLAPVPQPQPTSSLVPAPSPTQAPQPQPTSYPAQVSSIPSTTSLPSPATTSSSVFAPTATTLPAGSGCSNPRVRPEWRSLSRQQQAGYITAVKCLAKLPSKLLPGGDYRRYDDFENVHSRMRSKIHWVSLFLPWHRHFMFLYEQALKNECGYTGNLPRWDWTQDANDMTRSPVWSSDPQVGFGSNGRNFTDVDPALDGGVVTDGAFANWDLYYPEYHQLQRNYNLPSQYKVSGRSWGSQYFDQAAVSSIQSQSTYAKFAVALEGTDPSSTGPSNPGPHSIIHVIVGGDISPSSYAANEPLFYLHHTNVDYHWWRWQNAQRSTRLNAYGGPTTRGSTADTAKVTDSLKFLSLSVDVSVQDTMDTYSAKYCYTY